MSRFQIIVVIVLLYTLFFGKRQLMKIDAVLSGIVARIRKMPPPEHGYEKKYGKDKTIEEIKLFGRHVLMFLTAHAIFYLFVYYGSREERSAQSGQWIGWLGEQFQLHESLIQMNKIWSAVLLPDAVVSFSNLIFPKKPDDMKDVSR